MADQENSLYSFATTLSFLWLWTKCKIHHSFSHRSIWKETLIVLNFPAPKKGILEEDEAMKTKTFKQEVSFKKNR